MHVLISVLVVFTFAHSDLLRLKKTNSALRQALASLTSETQVGDDERSETRVGAFNPFASYCPKRNGCISKCEENDASKTRYACMKECPKALCQLTCWEESSKGVDLAPGEFTGDSQTSFDDCLMAAMDKGVDYVAWTDEVYNGFCKILDKGITNPNFKTYQGYGYKLYKNTCSDERYEAQTQVGEYGYQSDQSVEHNLCQGRCGGIRAMLNNKDFYDNCFAECMDKSGVAVGGCEEDTELCYIMLETFDCTDDIHSINEDMFRVGYLLKDYCPCMCVETRVGLFNPFASKCPKRNDCIFDCQANDASKSRYECTKECPKSLCETNVCEGKGCAECLDDTDYACAFYDGKCTPTESMKNPEEYDGDKFVWRSDDCGTVGTDVNPFEESVGGQRETCLANCDRWTAPCSCCDAHCHYRGGGDLWRACKFARCGGN